MEKSFYSVPFFKCLIRYCNLCLMVLAACELIQRSDFLHARLQRAMVCESMDHGNDVMMTEFVSFISHTQLSTLL